MYQNRNKVSLKITRVFYLHPLIRKASSKSAMDFGLRKHTHTHTIASIAVLSLVYGLCHNKPRFANLYTHKV